MKKYDNPIPVGRFGSVSDGVRKIHRSTDTWWLKKAVLIIFLIGFSAVDGVTLYPVFEFIFASSPVILYATTFGTAVAINFIPCIAARFYLRAKYGLQEQNYSLFYVALAIFGLIFIALGALRFATAGEVIGNLSSFMSSSSGTSTDHSGVAGSIPMIVVQITTNLLTSTIAFFLSYFSENPLKMRIEAIELQIKDYEKRSIALDCAQKELSMYDFEKIMEHEERKCALAHEALEARREALKIESDKQLEMLLASADADTVITDAQKAEDVALTKQSVANAQKPTHKSKLNNTYSSKEVA